MGLRLEGDQSGETGGRILVVEDDPSLRDLVVETLRREGFRTEEVGNGERALASLRAQAPDLVLLDLGLPDTNGLDVLRAIRRSGDVPVIIITGRGNEADRVVGLELGADDYVVKPILPRELTARVRSVLRRARPQAAPTSLDFGGLLIDAGARETKVGGRVIEMTPKEFDLLLFLASSPRQVFSRAQILQGVWGTEWQSETTVTEHIRRLRQKIEPDSDKPKWIKTIRGIGYKFEP